MNFLLELGFSEELINKMINRYDKTIIEEFILEEGNVVDVIKYLQKIGVEPIDELLLTRIQIFTKDINDVKDAFLKHNIKKMVDKINQDINNIDFV